MEIKQTRKSSKTLRIFPWGTYDFFNFSLRDNGGRPIYNDQSDMLVDLVARAIRELTKRDLKDEGLHVHMQGINRSSVQLGIQFLFELYGRAYGVQVTYDGQFKFG